jgi:hypothetical protein
MDSPEGANNHGDGHKSRSEAHDGGISGDNNKWLIEGCEERGSSLVYMVSVPVPARGPEELSFPV